MTRLSHLQSAFGSAVQSDSSSPDYWLQAETDFYFGNMVDYPLDKTSEVKMIPTIDLKATGENIKTLMDEREMSVKYVSAELGFGCVQGVYKWIHGRCLPSIDNLVALSYLLQVRMEDILVLEERG